MGVLIGEYVVARAVVILIAGVVVVVVVVGVVVVVAAVAVGSEAGVVRELEEEAEAEGQSGRGESLDSRGWELHTDGGMMEALSSSPARSG
jgi:hypothetical protein